MKMLKLFLSATLLSFVGFWIASFVLHDVEVLQIVGASILMGILITWTFNPILPFNFRRQAEEERHSLSILK